MKDRYIAPVAAALTLAAGLGAAACGGEPTCESQFKVSQEYPGGPANLNGLEVETAALTENTRQVEIGFTDPGDNWHDQWIPAREASKVAMSIGPNAVRFRVRIEAVKESIACRVEPNTRFVRKSYEEIVREGATIPDPAKFRLDQAR